MPKVRAYIQIGSNYEKSGGRNSRWTVPLNLGLIIQNYSSTVKCRVAPFAKNGVRTRNFKKYFYPTKREIFV